MRFFEVIRGSRKQIISIEIRYHHIIREIFMTGVTVSHYKILEKLGEGGMGIVYKAHDIKLDRTVALKFLPPHLTQSEEDKQRFIREAKAAAALNHPHICTIHSVDDHDGGQFIVMEYVDGTTLRHQLETINAKSETAIDYALQIAEALAEAHEKGIVHRDIKPENIMVDSKNRIKVMDFGLARIAGSLNLTQTGSTVGTILYMSPEQVRGEQIDHRTDIWSLGVVMYEMLTGTLPFKGEYEHAVSYRILNEDPQDITKIASIPNPDIQEIIRKSLAKDPVKRFSNIGEMISELHKFRESLKKPAVVRNDNDSSTKRIAVLPIVNMSPDIQDEYFSDGMTEEIISMLSKISGLRVIARTTMMQYKSTTKSIGEIGRQLNVDSLLEGSVRKSSDNVRVSVQLIDSQTEETIWSERYDRSLKDVFAIQSDIAHQVAEGLKVKLLPQEQSRIDTYSTENIDSYTLYLKGRFHWNKFTYDGVMKSIEYFEEAIKYDPAYALGYVGLSAAYGVLGLNFSDPRAAFEKSKAAAQRALELDPLFPEAHGVRGAMYFFNDHDWNNAEQAFKHAIELNRSNAEAHELYAYFLSAMGRHDQALIEINYAINLDPLSLIINKDLGSHLYWNRRYDDAIEQFKKTIEMEPNFFLTHGELGWAYSGKGLYEKALSSFKEAIRISGGARSVDVAGMGYIYGRIGEHDKAREVLTDLLNQAKQRYISPEDIALVYAALNDFDNAFFFLNEAVNKRGFWTCFLMVDHRFDILRNDRRFQQIVDQMGFA
jgi:eukaryotic-like serine/threonine-protein kinase